LSAICTDISIELSKLGKVEEALTWARRISDDEEKIRALSAISTELAKQGEVEEAASAMQEALTCARGINNDRQNRQKSKALSAISTELSKQGKFDEAASAMQEALTCARGIGDESGALSYISTELAKQGDWALAEKYGLQIPLIAERQKCWRTIASSTCNNDGWFKALQQVKKLQSDEARIFYLKGWAGTVEAPDAHCVQVALSHLAHDTESVEMLLQNHTLREIFFGQADPENLNQLNRSLNIQWALDTKAKFPEKESNARLSTNLDEWLHEIDDEDDKEDILGWADKVSSGKMTEEKFAERVRGK